MANWVLVPTGANWWGDPIGEARYDGTFRTVQDAQQSFSTDMGGMGIDAWRYSYIFDRSPFARVWWTGTLTEGTSGGEVQPWKTRAKPGYRMVTIVTQLTSEFFAPPAAPTLRP